MQWITRERPKIDRIACPWLVTRFIDQQPQFLFVPPADVSFNPYFLRKASKLQRSSS